MDQRGERDMMYCHECENEWYRDEHGLECPECQSDFTEVIERDHDPRDDQLDDVPGDEPPLLHDHNPWADADAQDPYAPDPDEADINQFHWQRTGPNTMHLTGTFTRTIGPRGLPPLEVPQNGGNPAMLQFTNMLQGILGMPQMPQGRQPQQDAQNNPDPDGQPERPNSAPGNADAGNGIPPGVQVRVGGGPGFTWRTATTHINGQPLHPRDANHPQPHGQPLQDLPNVLAQVFGLPPGMNGMAPNGGPNAGPDNRFTAMGPLGGWIAGLFNPADAQVGDGVYTQEAFDRIISQLMEQNQTGLAPGPASAAAIASLPIKSIDESDLSDTGKAECSICMDEVNIGDKVTSLPCRHWFHGECVKAWLNEHDSCPQCRQGIMPKDAPPNTQRPRRPDEAPRHDPMSGQGTGEGTREDPYIIGEYPRGQLATERRSSVDSRRGSASAGPSGSREQRDSQNNDNLLNSMRNAFGGGGS